MTSHHPASQQNTSGRPREAVGSHDGEAWKRLVTRAATHEFYAVRQPDAAAMSACALALAYGLAQGRHLLFVRHDALNGESGALHASGISELGLDPAAMILLRARDALSALQAALEGARCAALGAVIVEFWGEAKLYDLAASRRLFLAAKASGVPVFLLRSAARPVPSAAETRWQIRAAPSRMLAARAPGNPRFALALLRARSRQEGLSLHLEWDRDARTFRICETGARAAFNASPGSNDPAPLSGRVVPVSFHRQGAAHDGPSSHQRTG